MKTTAPKQAQHRRLASLILALVGSLFLFVTAVQADNGFVVTNTHDSGPGSLRQAITDANTFFGTDTVFFAIDNCGGVCTITPLSPLPPITERIHIDGLMQPGAKGN